MRQPNRRHHVPRWSEDGTFLRLWNNRTQTYQMVGDVGLGADLSKLVREANAGDVLCGAILEANAMVFTERMMAAMKE